MPIDYANSLAELKKDLLSNEDVGPIQFKEWMVKYFMSCELLPSRIAYVMINRYELQHMVVDASFQWWT